MQQFADKLAELATTWNRIERRAKEYEHFQNGANVAAINEMRYAGRRIVDAIAILAKNGNELEVRDHLVVAESYLVNADHDVTDGICFVVMRRLDRVIKRYSRERIAKHYPAFWETYALVVKAQKIVQGSREDRALRKAEYAKLAEEYLPKFDELYSVLINEPALRVRDDSEELAAIRARVIFVQVVSIVGSIASLLALALALVVWAYPNSYWTWFHYFF